MALLESKGILLRCYTQNIDSLETLAGVDPGLVVAAHGNFEGKILSFYWAYVSHLCLFAEIAHGSPICWWSERSLVIFRAHVAIFQELTALTVNMKHQLLSWRKRSGLVKLLIVLSAGKISHQRKSIILAFQSQKHHKYKPDSCHNSLMDDYGYLLNKLSDRILQLL